MDIIQSYLTRNNCYLSARKLIPQGIMVHSTGCPGAMHKNFLSSWNVPKPNGVSVCVHGFLDNTGFYQTLPWNFQAWHAGGSANRVLIGFEVCEPKNYADKEYFRNVKQKVIDLCVYLCREFNLPSSSITTHCEGNQRYGSSYASAHSDIDHWWKKYHNYTMNDLRHDVEVELKKIEVEEKMIKEFIDIYGEDIVRAGLTKLFDSEKYKNEASDWAKEELEEAIKLGITDGSRPRDLSSRQEVALMVERAIKK